MTASPPPRLFDGARRALRLDRSAGTFGDADFLHRRAAADMADTLSATLRNFSRVVDLSPRPGIFTQALADRGGGGRLGDAEALDDAAWRADPGSTPLPHAPQSVDLFASVLGLHWANDLPGAMAQVRRALRPDGLFLATMFGGATLTELRQVLTEAELEETGGAAPRVSPFADGFDGAGLLQRAGFALPAVEVDRVTVRYDDILALTRDLRAMGETNVLAGLTRPLRRGVLARAQAIYTERWGEGGRIPATFEIISLAGWAPHESQQKPAARGSATTRLADVLGTVEQTGED
ncbi:methyltransferase domain-containing protein [Brevundimonas lutea]|uniref:methyltransferase domain-containing protein n=1 Tax=Brevundimonas lutea TaxID=2293980 RepID=UPI000F03AC89|nr:methyltransferase domain-containing protein [Brevundimonas lutea]